MNSHGGIKFISLCWSGWNSGKLSKYSSVCLPAYMSVRLSDCPISCKGTITEETKIPLYCNCIDKLVKLLKKEPYCF